MTHISWRSASAGFSKTIAIEATTVLSLTTPPHTTFQLVSTSRKGGVQTRSVDLHTFVSIQQLRFAMLSAGSDTAKRAANVPTCTRTSVRTLRTRANVFEVINANTGMFIVRLECGNQLVALRQMIDRGQHLRTLRLPGLRRRTGCRSISSMPLEHRACSHSKMTTSLWRLRIRCLFYRHLSLNICRPPSPRSTHACLTAAAF